MKTVRFHPEAAAELEEAVAFYEARRTGLGRALLRQVEVTTARIQQYPGIGAPDEETQLRHHVLTRFPYVLFYLELREVIWIVAVAHGRRRPGYWHHRTIEHPDEQGTPDHGNGE